ncbi:MAG: barstar family protein [Caldilineaceae bacterium]
MNPVEQILVGTLPPGLYRLTNAPNADYLMEPLVRHGWRGFYIDGTVVKDKDSFLRIAAAAMEFPLYFGHNWDAFEECVTDLAWAPAKGYVLLYDGVFHFARRDRAAWRTARSILADAVTHWQTAGKPFYVLLRNTWWYAHDLEKV